MKRFAFVLALAAAACRHEQVKPAAAEPPVQQPAPAPVAEPAAPPVEVAVARACSADDQCGPSQLCVDTRCVDAVPGLAACRATVHFAYDSAAPVREELPVLQRVARCASAGAAPLVTIDGNADERGTVEYNLALGDRRANAVAGYLEHLGVPRARLKTVTYGKERPVCTEHVEACWAENRRASAAPGDGSDRSP